jgi:hypothetical protein
MNTLAAACGVQGSLRADLLQGVDPTHRPRTGVCIPRVFGCDQATVKPPVLPSLLRGSSFTIDTRRMRVLLFLIHCNALIKILAPGTRVSLAAT